MDTSSYIGQENFSKVKAFIIAIVEKLKLYDGQSRIGIITFSGAARVERYLSEPANKEDIFAAIHGLIYDGDYPFMPDALSLLTEELFTKRHGDRPNVPNFAILITGGLVFSEFTQPLAYDAQEAGIHVFGIGVGLSRTDAAELNQIVSNPAQASASYGNNDISRLNEMVDRIVATLCEGRRKTVPKILCRCSLCQLHLFSN